MHKPHHHAKVADLGGALQLACAKHSICLHCSTSLWHRRISLCIKLVSVSVVCECMQSNIWCQVVVVIRRLCSSSPMKRFDYIQLFYTVALSALSSVMRSFITIVILLTIIHIILPSTLFGSSAPVTGLRQSFLSAASVFGFRLLVLIITARDFWSVKYWIRLLIQRFIILCGLLFSYYLHFAF